MLKATENELVRALNEVGPERWVIEYPTGTNDAQQGLEREVFCSPAIAQDLEIRRGQGVLVEIELAELVGKISPGRRLCENQSDDVIAGKVSRLPKNGLSAGIMKTIAKEKFISPNAVTGKGPGGLLYIRFGIVSLTQCEELEQLAGKVFIGLAFSIFEQVEKLDYGRGLAGGLAEGWVGFPDMLPQNFLVVPEVLSIPHRLQVYHPDVLEKLHELFPRTVFRLPGKLQPVQGVDGHGFPVFPHHLLIGFPALIRVPGLAKFFPAFHVVQLLDCVRHGEGSGFPQ